MGAFGNLLQGGRTILARLAARNPDLDNLFVSKKAKRAAARQHLAPVKMGAGHCVHAALGKALLPCLGPQGISKLLQQQRLVTMQRVQAFELALEVFVQLGRGEIHA